MPHSALRRGAKSLCSSPLPNACLANISWESYPYPHNEIANPRIKPYARQEVKLMTKLKIDKTALSLVPNFDTVDEKAYWLSRTPSERLQHIEV